MKKRKKRSKDRVCALCEAKESNTKLIEVTIDGVKNRICEACQRERV